MQALRERRLAGFRHRFRNVDVLLLDDMQFIAMYLARKHTDLSFPEIARLMGNKNHTTVLLACRRIGKLLEERAEVTWPGAAVAQTLKIEDLVQSQEEQLRC